jgi:ankyrin repeat protein
MSEAADVDKLLFEACARGERAEAARLLAAGARPLAARQIRDERYTAFHMACIHCPDMLPLFADGAAETMEGTTQTMLHISMQYALGLDALRALLPRADARATDSRGRTALHDACQFGADEGPVRELIRAGADILHRAENGHNALAAAFCNPLHAVRIIPHVFSQRAFEEASGIAGVSWSALQVACALPGADAVDVGLAGAGRTPVQGYTCMQIAAAAGNAQLVQRLARAHPHMAAAAEVAAESGKGGAL